MSKVTPTNAGENVYKKSAFLHNRCPLDLSWYTTTGEQDSIPAPLGKTLFTLCIRVRFKFFTDYSSDSEFAAGPVKPMEKGSGKRRNTKSKRESIRPAKKRKVVWSDSEDEEWMTSFDSSVNATSESMVNRTH